MMNSQKPRLTKAPKGECRECDDYRADGTDLHPPHDPSTRCRNAAAGRKPEPHCTCDACF